VWNFAHMPLGISDRNITTIVVEQTILRKSKGFIFDKVYHFWVAVIQTYMRS